MIVKSCAPWPRRGPLPGHKASLTFAASIKIGILVFDEVIMQSMRCQLFLDQSDLSLLIQALRKEVPRADFKYLQTWPTKKRLLWVGEVAFTDKTNVRLNK